MNKNNLSVFFIKAVFVCIASVFTTGTAFAQITLDFGVLADDYPATDEHSVSAKPEKNTITLENPEKGTKKAEAPQKAKKAVPPQKTKAKSTPPVPKTTVKSKEKYQVTESALKDEHDKLKPEAAPAPKVKVISANSYPGTPSEGTAKPADKTEANVPKISKHFLEQSKNEKKDGTETKQASETKPDTAPAKKRQTETSSFASGTRQTEPAKVRLHPNKQQQTASAQKETPSILNFSVYPVSEKLSAQERSAFLSNEIPEDSATVKALNDKKLLTHILIFEKASTDLTEEMQNVLNETAVLMKNDKTKRLVLYAYSSQNPAAPGKERQYALRRALAVRSYLTSKGVLSLRVELRAQGTTGAGNKIPDRTDMVLSAR